MKIDRGSYRPWRGARRAATMRFWPIARTGLGLVLRRRAFWVFLLIGLLNFFFHSALIYLVTVQLRRAAENLPFFLRVPDRVIFRFNENGLGYREFLFSQGVMLMIMLGFAGSILVGNDLRFNSIAFYLSKPLTRLHYFAGKVAAVFCLAALLTLVPALALFVEYGAFSESFAFYVDNWRILTGILGYGVLICLVTSTVLLGVSSLLEKTIPTLIVWGGIFVFLPAIGTSVRAALGRQEGTDQWGWALLNLWSTMRWIGNVMFDYRPERDPDRYVERLPWSLVVVIVWVVASTVVFWWRIRRSEVVR